MRSTHSFGIQIVDMLAKDIAAMGIDDFESYRKLDKDFVEI